MLHLKGETMYYDRAFKIKCFRSGMGIVHDLNGLYHMAWKILKYDDLSSEARKRVKWFDYYRKCQNVSLTCRHFDISRKTFYKWYNRYDPHNLYSLEDQSRAPINKRKREITSEQETRIIKLRKEHIKYGKMKIAKLYQEEYGEEISSWKVQRVIELYRLYHNPQKTAKTTRKRLSAVKKKRITELKRKRKKKGFLLCLDAIEIRWHGLVRHIFTAIDNFTKVGFARMYKRANSYNAQDFLNRLYHLADGKINNLQTDNGSEFEKYFQRACQRLNIERYYNRPRTPKDNPVNERFNRTLQEEFISLGNFTPNTVEFNRNLTEWLIEYNFRRPHEALNYETPIKTAEVLPMYSSYTFPVKPI